MARPAVTEAGNNGDDDNGQRKKRGRWRKGTASSAIMGHGAATEVTGSAGGEQEPVTPGAHPTLFLSGTSAPELSQSTHSWSQKESVRERWKRRRGRTAVEGQTGERGIDGMNDVSAARWSLAKQVGAFNRWASIPVRSIARGRNTKKAPKSNTQRYAVTQQRNQNQPYLRHTSYSCPC